MEKPQIKFAFIQIGYCVFGAGESRDAAIEDAANWLEPEHGQQGDMTPAEVEALLKPQPNYGDFKIINHTHEEFDSYLKNQGGFEQIEGKWFLK